MRKCLLTRYSLLHFRCKITNTAVWKRSFIRGWQLYRRCFQGISFFRLFFPSTPLGRTLPPFSTSFILSQSAYESGLILVSVLNILPQLGGGSSLLWWRERTRIWRGGPWSFAIGKGGCSLRQLANRWIDIRTFEGARGPPSYRPPPYQRGASFP